jgi:hypothetical protein
VTGCRGLMAPPKLASSRDHGGGCTSGTASRVRKPVLDEMGIATWHEVKPDRVERARPRKPTLDEMGPGTESRIYRPTSTLGRRRRPDAAAASIIPTRSKRLRLAASADCGRSGPPRLTEPQDLKATPATLSGASEIDADRDVTAR